jgi:catechol 2,3-dioxygenase
MGLPRQTMFLVEKFKVAAVGQKQTAKALATSQQQWFYQLVEKCKETAMQLTWSHAVMYVHSEQVMLDFYTRVLGFEITDRGPLGDNGPDIIFLSQSPNEHHQLAMLPVRQGTYASNSVNHFAFRVAQFSDLQELYSALSQVDGVNIGPLSHGNTLSLYFNDPEGNGLEVFWDTPWHVAQPQGETWDVAMTQEQALAWVEETFGNERSFQPSEHYYAQRRMKTNP